MNRKAIAAVLAALFMTVSMFAATNAVSQGNHAKWLYLLYLDADNSLDVYVGPGHYSVVGSDYDELMSVGSSKDVACYVLADRLDDVAHLFKVEKGAMVEMKGSALNGVEINMGDPATLTSFVSFASGASPADHMLLIFWDHGSPRGVAWDDHASAAGGEDFLSHWEVTKALKSFTVDVIAADECNVGQMEVAYEYATNSRTKFLVAAETYTGWRGFPYDQTLKALVDNPDMTPIMTATMMIEQTQILLDQPPYMGENINSHAAIDLGKVRDLAYSLNGLTNLLTPKIMDYRTAIGKARGNAQYCYGANAINLIDMRTFVDTLKSNIASREVKAACTEVLADFDAALVKLHATHPISNMVCGMGIAFPDHSWELSSYYGDYAFAELGWPDFMAAYWAACGSV